MIQPPKLVVKIEGNVFRLQAPERLKFHLFTYC